MITANTTLLNFARKVEDFRTGNRVFYPSASIVFMAFVGVLCGAKEWEDVVEIGESCADLLKELLEDDFVGVPSHDTFNRFFNLISTASMEKAFRETMSTVYAQSASPSHKEVVAVDGKYLKGVKGNSALNMVSAYATELGICLGQEEADKKINEPEAFRRLLGGLELKNYIVTADALHCEKESAKAIVQAKGDYILIVKGNQLHLQEAIKEAVRVESIRGKKRFIDRAEEISQGHGRTERRICYSCSHKGWLPNLGRDWENLQSFGCITCERTDHATGQVSTETRCFISTLKMDAAAHMRWIRSEWKIENNLHWQLDVTFKEDACRMTKAQSKNLSLLRKLAMPVLKDFKYKKNASMRKKMLAAALKPDIKRKLILSALAFYANS